MAKPPLLSGIVAWFPFKGNHAPFQMKVMEKNGALVVNTLTPEVTHIVCEPTEKRSILTNALPAGKTLESYEIVTRAFMAECLRSGRLQDPDNFRPLLTPVDAPPAASSPPSSSQFKRQRTGDAPTLPPQPSTSAVAHEAQKTDAEPPIDEENEEKEPCVVERRGSEWVAVRGRLPRFTGGNTGLPWGSHGVWDEPYDPDAAHRTVETLRNYWYRSQSAPGASSSRPGSASGPPLTASAGSTPSKSRVHTPSGPAPSNGVCSHVACSSLSVCILAALDDVRATYSPRKDQFKIKQIERAQQAVARHPAPLRDPDDADAVDDLVAKSLLKVKEILSVGRVASKVDVVETDERAQALARLQEVWGAGETVAEGWYRNGCRTVADVRKAAAEGLITLTEQQRCGITHFEDLEKRIPRAAVAAVEGEVRRAVFEALEQATSGNDAERTYCYATGSYRRGAPDSSDIDMLIILPPSAVEIDCGEFLHDLLGVLVDRGLVLDELDPRGVAKGRRHAADHMVDHKSWMGVCRPPGLDQVARIDVKVYSPHLLVYAVNYFSNSMEFCRATRHWATGAAVPQEEAQKLAPAATGFKLSAHGMFPRAFREGAGGKREDDILGVSVELSSETELFERLGLSYVPVTMRFFHGGYQGAAG